MLIYFVVLLLSSLEQSGVASSVGANLLSPQSRQQLTLLKELKSDSPFHALDLISEKKMKFLLDDLVNLSATDESGFFYLAMNSFFTRDTSEMLSALYLVRLSDIQTSAASRVVIIDTLYRMGIRVRKNQISDLLLKDPSPEVRSAALAYLRGMILLWRDDSEFLALMSQVLKEKNQSRQFQAQASVLEAELRQKRILR